ncbi:DUF1772-domain-containing protein [Thozetella sp. PMI_491]|nr:DUF1772-domain-containing protein [Thozetella sp. PMI_491]
MADSKQLSIRAAQAVGVFTSSFVSGASLGLSVFVIPRLLELPSPLMLRQWERTFSQGRRLIPAVGQTAALSYFYLAYRFGLHRGITGRLYLLAGALSFSIIPYTLILVMPTNRRLLKKAKDAKQLAITEELVEVGAREESAKYLVDQWGLHNLGRAALLMASSAIGLLATL